MSSEKNVITPTARRALIGWAIALILLYALVGYGAFRKLSDYKAQSDRTRQLWLAATETDGVPLATDSDAAPAPVTVGVYVNRISDISMRESGWTADFDVWFRWTDPSLNPGETFKISNGEIEAREKVESIALGADRYARYRVKARLAKQFDPTRLPFVDEALVLQMEDSVHDARSFQWVADKNDSGVSPTAITQGLVGVTGVVTGVRLHNIGSNFGKPDDPSERSNVRSQFIYAVMLSPPGLRSHFKLFNVFFFSVAIAFLALFIRPTHVDPRFGLGTGAVFAVIGNMIVLASELPRVNSITLADMITALALGTIVLTLAQSAISLYLYDSLGLKRLSVVFDKVSLAVFAAGYIALNIILPAAAKS